MEQGLIPAVVGLSIAMEIVALAALKPQGFGPLILAAFLTVDTAWLGASALFCKAPAVDTLLFGPAVLAGVGTTLASAAAVGAIASILQSVTSVAVGGDVLAAILTSTLLPILAAGTAFSIDLERREKLSRLRATLGSLRRMQIGELFPHTLFQVREYMTSVTSVAEALSLQAQNTPLAEKMGRLRALVQECNAKIGRLMDTMRARATARRAAAPEPFQLADALDEAAKAATELHGAGQVTAIVRCEQVPPLSHDRATVRDLILTVALNASEALGPKGGTIYLEGKMADKLVEVSVSDDGGGIRDELLGEVFNPFFTTKETQGGLGLGLSMARRIAREMGGNLDLATDGSRTVARISFPTDAGLPQVFTGDSTWASRRGSAGK
ncbi:MAG: HAMP domain-containing histidine kinase [Elusimicrobia bacterium]|nr:HAMP domain-containing histidine kinase [Elusimicrobiota bacterium]